MAFDLPSTGDRRRRRMGAPPEPRPRDDAPRPPAPSPAPRGPDPARSPEPVRGPEPAPAATILTAAQLQSTKIDDAVARELKVDKGDMMGWWRRKFYVVGNAAFGSVVGMSAGSLAAKALVGTALAATLPSWAIGAGAAIPTVMLARYLLGLNKVDRMAKAGRVADKLKRRTSKAEKAAARAGGSFTMNDAQLAEQAKVLSNRVSWGAVAAGVGAGWLTGSIAYELHMPGPNPVTDTVRGGARGIWDRISSGSWWQARAGGLWNALFGTVAENPEAAPRAPAAAHGIACDGALEQIRALEVDLSNAQANVSSLNRLVDSLKASLVRAGDDLRISDTTRRLFGDQLDALRTEYTDLFARYQRSEITGAALEAHIRTLTERAGGLEVELRRLIEENARLRSAPRPFVFDVPYGRIPNEAPPAAPWSLSVGGDAGVFAGLFDRIPLDMPISGPRSDIARHGLDGLLNETILPRLRAPEGARLQLIEAVRTVFVANPEFAQRLLDTDAHVIRGRDIVFPDHGSVDMRIFGDRDFLQALRSEILAPGRQGAKYSELVSFFNTSRGSTRGFLTALERAFSR